MALPPGPARAALLQTWAWIRRPETFLEGCREEYGDRFTLRFVGERDFVVLSRPDDVRELFTASPELLLTGRANRSFATFLGRGSLFVLDGEDHRRHRRALMPPFRGERMRAYGPLIRDATDAHLARWPRLTPFRLIDALHDVTLQIIFEAVFGVTDPRRAAELRHLVALAVTRAPAMLVYLPALQRDLGPLSPWRRFVRTRSRLHAMLDEEIARARTDHAGRHDILARLVAPRAGEEAREDSLRPSRGGFGGALEARRLPGPAEGKARETSTGQDPPRDKGMTDHEVRDELVTLLGAGHETTTAALAWAFQWILGTPMVRERLTAEVRGLGGGPLPVEHVEGLPYLRACVDEALRLHPPIPVVPRFCARDLPLAGMQLTAGTYVCASPYLTHRDPRVFAEPARYLPERFLGRSYGPFELYPFGGGPRACIGMAFAAYEMAVVIATVLARADLELAGVPSLLSRRRSIIVAPREGTPVSLRSRLW